MALVDTKKIFEMAYKHGYAVGAFNIHNLETLLAIVDASTEEQSPVIVAVTPSTIEYAGMEYLSTMVRIAAESVRFN